MQLYLTAAPEQLQAARACTDYVVHRAYHIGSDGRLHRQPLPLQARGGLMELRGDGGAPLADPEPLCREIFRECARRAYAGVVADMDGEQGRRLLPALEQLLVNNHRQLYVPCRWGKLLHRSRVLVSTALSGGSLRLRLQELANLYGSGRLALRLQRLIMDFPLPCPEGTGTALSPTELETLLSSGQCVFYSRDLGAKYFTHRQEGKDRFLLFDDGDTLLRKIRLAENLGIGVGILEYGQAAPFLPRLFPEKR